MLLCEIENYGFLRESQTFVGVLISILTLCILMESKDNSNIIKRLIEYATDRRIKKIDSLIKFHSEPQDISTKEKDNTRREAYKDRGCLSSFLRHSEKSDKLLAEKKFVEEGVYLQSMATVEQLCVITIDESDRQRVNQLTGNLSKRYLPAMASFYSLLYGLIIFLCDEISILWGACTKDFIVSFTAGITSLSLAFWFVLWISFLFTNRLNGYSGEEEKGDSYLRRFTVLVDPEKFWRFILTIMLLFACFCAYPRGPKNNHLCHRSVASRIGSMHQHAPQREGSIRTLLRDSGYAFAGLLHIMFFMDCNHIHLRLCAS